MPYLWYIQAYTTKSTKVVYSAATWATFKPKLKKMKICPDKILMFQEMKRFCHKKIWNFSSTKIFWNFFSTKKLNKTLLEENGMVAQAISI